MLGFKRIEEVTKFEPRIWLKHPFIFRRLSCTSICCPAQMRLGFCTKQRFLRSWNALWTECPWATLFQKQNFVIPWYRIYASRYEPVLLAANGDDGDLIGLLLLAQERSTGILVHAGAHQAEYQTWIARPGLGNAFIVSALDVISEIFSPGTLTFLYLPPLAPRHWVEPDRNNKWAARTMLRPVRRGLMDLGDQTRRFPGR